MAAVASTVQSRYLTAVSRLARALEGRDDIIWSLGSYLTTPVLEDCMDDFDHLLLLLCGGVDVIARALHLALGLDAEDVRSAKLHINSSGSWYATNVVDRYGANPEVADELAELSRLQPHLTVLFELRNSIHNVQIQPVLAIPSSHGSSSPRGEAPFLAYVTADIAQRIKATGPGVMAEWGFRDSAGRGAVADLWVITDKAVDTTIRFLDLLSHIALRNPLPASASAVLSGEVPATSPNSTPWEGYDDNLPTLLGLPVHQRVAVEGGRRSDVGDLASKVDSPGGTKREDDLSSDLMISVQETWWRAHVRSWIATLYRTRRSTVPSNTEDVRQVPDEWICDALTSARHSSGRQWPDAKTVAHAVLADRYSDLVRF